MPVFFEFIVRFGTATLGESIDNRRALTSTLHLRALFSSFHPGARCAALSCAAQSVRGTSIAGRNEVETETRRRLGRPEAAVRSRCCAVTPRLKQKLARFISISSILSHEASYCRGI